MNIMLVCAGGMSSGILMNKMKKWGEENQKDLKVKAYGMGEFENEVQNYQCILLGPQISYKEKEIRANAGGIPVAQISSMDYALGNVENIMKQVEKMGISFDQKG